MWRPRTEGEIQTAIDNGTTVETSSFDAKRELPASGKNKDLAKDICAMTVDGGTLLYGLGGDDPTRPNERFPFATQGARERVDSVAQTAIQEPPVIDVYEIDSEENPGTGYLCVSARDATIIMEQSVTRALYQPLAVAEWLLDRAGFHGGADVGLAVMGIEGVGGASLIDAFGRRTSGYGAPEYRRHARVTGEELRGDLDNIVRQLLQPLYEVTSARGYDPLAARLQ